MRDFKTCGKCSKAVQHCKCVVRAVINRIKRKDPQCGSEIGKTVDRLRKERDEYKDAIENIANAQGFGAETVAIYEAIELLKRGEAE